MHLLRTWLLDAALSGVVAISSLGTATAASAAAAAAAAAAASLARAPGGSLALVDGSPLFTFRYSTPSPDPKNWIGIYNTFGGGPDNETFVSPSLTWAYAAEAAGSVQVAVSTLQPGTYKAYFLAKDAYKWLADPIHVVLPGQGPVSFLVGRFTTHNARQGDKFEANIRGLLANPPDTKTRFARTASPGGGSRDDWVRVSPDGRVSGTPSASGETRVTVEATASNGSKAQLRVMIPVRSAGSPLVAQLSVLTFNLWHGGTQVSDYHRKQVRFLVDSAVDIVGVQESSGGHATRLAQALGWHSWQHHDVGIISRYPIVAVYPEAQAGGSVRVALDGAASQVIVWNAHLGYTPYGPYDFCFDNMSVDQVLQREAQSGRSGQMADIASRIKQQMADANGLPVLLLGDMNAPSHLDWTDATRGLHCNVSNVPWPTSEEPIKAGLMDSFRQVHGDPLAEPGITWSPIYLDNEGRAEPMDRIDFVYHSGFEVLRSETLVVGRPKPEPNHRDNDWTSDHAAVRSVFRVPSRPQRPTGL